QTEALAAECAAAGRPLVERLTAHPPFVRDAGRWFDPAVAPIMLRLADSEGLARDADWSPGVAHAAPGSPGQPLGVAPAILISPALDRVLAKASRAETLDIGDIVRLFEVRGGAANAVVQAADRLRREVNGETVTYVVNRNINY